MKNITVAMDSFKGSLTSKESSKIIKNSILKIFPDSNVNTLLIADGGEGTLEALEKNSKKIDIDIQNPSMKKIRSYYLINDKNEAIIESAKAIGLPLLKDEEKNPLTTSSYGLGEMINDALDRGCKDITITLGGTATNDAGVGMLRALGYRFLDINSQPIENNDLEKIVKIDSSFANGSLKDANFKAVLDVTNPMYGKYGCSRVFAPQKGASKENIEILEKRVENFCRIVQKEHDIKISDIKGSGAGGCIAGALKAFFNAEFISGIDLILKIQNFEDKIKNSDLIISGEGKIDSQTLRGKALYGIAKECKKQKKPLIAICANIDINPEQLKKIGIDAVFSIINKPMSLNEALKKERTEKLLQESVEEIFKVIKISKLH